MQSIVSRMAAKMMVRMKTKTRTISSIAAGLFWHMQVCASRQPRLSLNAGHIFYAVLLNKFYTGKQLLKPTNLQFERNHRYGVVGNNGVGKTTLLNRIASGEINGFPQNIKVLYIQHGVRGPSTRPHSRAAHRRSRSSG